MFFKKYYRNFLFGLLSGLAFAPTHLLVFVPIGFFYLLTNLNDIIIVNKKQFLIQSFLYGFTFGFGYFLIQLYWISFSLFVDIKTYFWLVPIVIIAVPFICAIFIGFSTLFTNLFTKYFNVENKILITVIFSLFFVLFEFLRRFIFPWSIFSYTLGFSDRLIQISYLLNIYVLDFVLIFLFSFLFVLMEIKNNKIVFIKKNIIFSIIYIKIIFAIFGYGSLRLHDAKNKTFNKTFRIVQANIPQTLKWSIEESENTINKYINLTKQNGLDDVNIIVWSESAIPYIMTNYSRLDEKFNFIKDKYLIAGTMRGTINNEGIDKLWNSIFIFKNNDILDYYDKKILVPFGEFVPFSKYLPFINKLTQGNIEFSRGKKNKTINIDGIKISPIVCYEIAFFNGVIDKNDKPDLIVNLTNDGWFGKSSGPYQHLVLAKFRAVENKIPVIRVSNSGISAYIDEYGRIQNKIPLNKVEVLDVKK